MLLLAGLIAIMAIATVLRLAPQLIAPHGIGVDHWFWKAYIEKYQATGEFPPVLPQFRLDKEQWYPPLFPLLMAKLPAAIFDRYSYYLAVFIDLTRMALLLATVWVVNGNSSALLAAGIAYATSPILITYNVQLNPRGLGALFLDVVIVSLVWAVWGGGPLWLWAGIVGVSGLILLTHKMTTQLYWFLALVVGLVLRDWRFVALLPASAISAMIMSRGFYLKVLRAHWDIVSFWARNWPWLGAHPVLESPIYGAENYETPTKYFRSGIAGQARRMLYIFGFNPWAWACVLALAAAFTSEAGISPEDTWAAYWVSIILLFTVLTTYVPVLRCLGSGYLYLYNTTFPAALFVGLAFGEGQPAWTVELLLCGALAVSLLSFAFYLRTLLRSRTLKVDHDLDAALEHLRAEPAGVVMCFPQHWHDVVAYRTGKAVLFGAHGYGFRGIEHIFPRVMKGIGEIIIESNVRYILTYQGYLPENFLKEIALDDSLEFGNYRLLVVSQGSAKLCNGALQGNVPGNGSPGPKIVMLIVSMRGGGAERVTAILSSTLVNRSARVKIFTLESPDCVYDLPPSVTVERLKSGILCKGVGKVLAIPVMAMEFAYALAAFKADAAISLLVRPNMVHVLSRWFGNRRPIVISERSHTLRQFGEDRFRHKVILRLLRWLYPRADRVVAISKGVKDAVVSLGVFPERVTVIYNPICLASVRALKLAPVSRQLPTNKAILISVGRLHPEKDYETLLRAFKLVLQSRDAELLILGDGPLEQDLRRLASELGIDGAIQWLGWQPNPFCFLARADVFILTSKFEGFGNVLVEAMACGTPVVSTDCQSGPREILSDGQCGALVPVGDHRAIAREILDILSKPERREALRTRGLKRAEDFEVEAVSTRYLETILPGTMQPHATGSRQQ